MRAWQPLRRQATALDPYQILAVNRSASSREIKQAYYSLVKKYHPDLPAAKKPKNFDFKDIVAAYDLLRDDTKRSQYLKYGMGWGSRPTSAQQDYGFNFDNMHNPWKPRDGRRHRHAHERPKYPSTAWDFGQSDSTDFYSSNKAYWNKDQDKEGNYTTNASFIAILAAMSALLYSVQFWRLAPPLSSSSSPDSASSLSSFVGADPKDARIYQQSGMMRGRDKHHDNASRALGAAREGAQRHGSARREGIRRRVRESTLEAIESGKIGTGHSLTEEQLPVNPDEDPYKYIRQNVPPNQRTRKKKTWTPPEPDSPPRGLDVQELQQHALANKPTQQ